MKAQQLAQLAAVIDSHSDWWRFPEEATVRGFLGTDRLFIVGDQPSTSPWDASHPNRRAFYGLLVAIGVPNAHLTDLYKKRGRSGTLRSGLPDDFDAHLKFFREELAIIQPTRVVALGQLACDLLAKHVPEVRPMLSQMWHFAYPVRRGRLSEWEANARGAISPTAVAALDEYASRATAHRDKPSIGGFNDPNRAQRPRTQREVMRDLFVRYRSDPAHIISAYAAAERSGEVPRNSNNSGLVAEAYAKALLNDGLKKGWLK
jgi:hypothetical protein